MASDKTRFYIPTTRDRMDLVPKVSGKGLKKSNIADARKEGWFPSVTEVCKLWYSPAIEVYKEKQLLTAAFASPPIDGEVFEHWCKHIKDMADEHRDKAASFGIEAHAIVDAMFAGKLNKFPDESVKAVSPLLDLYSEEYSGWEMIVDEDVLIGRGYAGTCDKAFFDPSSGYLDIVDTKTQGAKQDAKGQVRWNYYETWALQLAAYKIALMMDLNDPSRIPDNMPKYRARVEALSQQSVKQVRCISIIQSSEGPWATKHPWDSEYITKAYQTFSSMRQCWNFFQNHDPKDPV